jgi:hypothetical protein
LRRYQNKGPWNFDDAVLAARRDPAELTAEYSLFVWIFLPKSAQRIDSKWRFSGGTPLPGAFPKECARA